MIKVELTKNVFNQHGGGLFGLKPIQIVFAVIAMAVGGVTVLWLMQYGGASGWEKPFFFPADFTETGHKILLSGGGRI